MVTAAEKKAAEADAAKEKDTEGTPPPENEPNDVDPNAHDRSGEEPKVETDALGVPKSENPADWATSQVVHGAPYDDPTDAGIAHQDSAPPDLTAVADEAAERGKLGGEDKVYDYTQKNPDVMGAPTADGSPEDDEQA